MSPVCVVDACPFFLNTSCIFYKGDDLLSIPATDGMTLTEILKNIDTKIGPVNNSGHVILDNTGSGMPQRPNLMFRRMIVSDNLLFNRTEVIRPPDTTVSITPPLNPEEGDIWINSQNMKKFVRYDNFWIEI